MTMRQTVAGILERHGIPASDITTAALTLADIVDRAEPPEHAVAATSALAALLQDLRAAYPPRSPLRDLLDAERARRITSSLDDSVDAGR